MSETMFPADVSLGAMPEDQRPRERLLRCGGRSLSDAELIAVLLRIGRPGLSAVGMAQQLLDEFGGIPGLVHTPPRRFVRKGLRQAKTATVMAALEVGRRLARAELPSGRLLEQPAAVVRYLMLHYDVPGQEVVGVLYLDVRGRLVGEREVYRGTLHRAVLEPRGIFRAALAQNASSVLLFHTHPSGDPSPSSQDLSVTRRLAEAGKLLGVPLVDHLILGSGTRWVSLRRHCQVQQPSAEGPRREQAAW